MPTDTVTGIGNVMPLDFAANALGDFRTAIQARVGQDHEEFLAADARGDVARAHRARHRIGHRAQHAIAEQVPVLVVDALEVIDVEHEQHVGLRGEFALHVGARAQAFQARAVQQAGELVVVRGVLQVVVAALQVVRARGPCSSIERGADSNRVLRLPREQAQRLRVAAGPACAARRRPR